jgi:hypothetical protein
VDTISLQAEEMWIIPSGKKGPRIGAKIMWRAQKESIHLMENSKWMHTKKRPRYL